MDSLTVVYCPGSACPPLPAAPPLPFPPTISMCTGEVQAQSADLLWTQSAERQDGPPGGGAMTDTVCKIIVLEMVSPNPDGSSGYEESCQGSRVLSRAWEGEATG